MPCCIVRYLPLADMGLRVRRARTVVEHSIEETSVLVEYLITSFERQHVTEEQIEQLRRGHCTIERVIHFVRDVRLGGARFQVRSGNVRQVFASVNVHRRFRCD